MREKVLFGVCVPAFGGCGGKPVSEAPQTSCPSGATLPVGDNSVITGR